VTAAPSISTRASDRVSVQPNGSPGFTRARCSSTGAASRTPK
jgi:hypothetical protein